MEIVILFNNSCRTQNAWLNYNKVCLLKFFFIDSYGNFIFSWEKLFFSENRKQKPVNIQACCQMKIICAKNGQIPSTWRFFFFFLLFHGIVMSYSKSFWQLLEDCWSTGHVMKTTFSLKDNCISKCWQCTQIKISHDIQSLRIIMQTTKENKLIPVELFLMHDRECA